MSAQDVKAIQARMAKAAGIPRRFRLSINMRASFTRIYEVEALDETEAEQKYHNYQATLIEDLLDPRGLEDLINAAHEGSVLGVEEVEE